MSNPLTTNPSEPLEADIQPFEFSYVPATVDETMPAFDQDLAETQEEFIAQTLNWCAELFGATRARFIRPLESGTWKVYTRQNGSILTHLADQAEIAMAYTVGLSRQPLVVSRPRISKIDGSGLRPIALKSYLGIPIICQDRLVGVVEFAGDVRPDMDAALYSAAPRLVSAGKRLVFDPGLRRKGDGITGATSVGLTGGIWARGDVLLSPTELRFLAAIPAATTIRTIADAGFDLDEAITIASDLMERGLLEAHSDPV